LLLLSVLLELLHPAVVGLHLLPQDGVLDLGRLFVKLDAADAVQPLHVQVSPPPHADAVEDEGREQMHLRERGRHRLTSISPFPPLTICRPRPRRR